jgi:hypothetical protein
MRNCGLLKINPSSHSKVALLISGLLNFEQERGRGASPFLACIAGISSLPALVQYRGRHLSGIALFMQPLSSLLLRKKERPRLSI